MTKNRDADSGNTGMRAMLARHGFRFKKQLGQNFLVDENVVKKIIAAADVGSCDGVFEIGPGAGAMTTKLADIARRVVAVEKDRGLMPILDERLADRNNVELIFADVLDLDLSKVWPAFVDCESVHVIANLPYYITTPILFFLLEAGVPIETMILMVQKEVADRLAAPPGGKDYGALTVSVQYRCDVEKVAHVSPGSFVPSPGVESTVVRLRVRRDPKVRVVDDGQFHRIVKAAFALRRKTILNALCAGLGMRKEEVAELLSQAEIVATRRGETLSLQEFADLANLFPGNP